MSGLKHTPVELAIVGGGAAGMFASAIAADRGVRAVLIERRARLGAKVLMTANGRCNFTKDISAERMLSDIGEPVSGFVRKALSELPPAKIIGGFRAAGLKLKRMQDGRMFPASENAADVVHVFGDLLREKELPIITNCTVTGVQPVKNGFIVGTDNFTLWAENVLLATGGVSFPKTGSVGDGQRFAIEMGHSFAPYKAGLTGYDLSRPGRGTYEAAEGRVVVDGEIRYRWRGELEFDRTGVSGAAVYNCQRWAAKNLRDGQKHTIELDYDGETLRLDSPRPRPVKEAIVTIGGVALKDVNPETMESRIVPGLYFAGEILDIDGPTGGYNLSMAFATARLAVESMIKGRKK